jgi:hypothetical protein
VRPGQTCNGGSAAALTHMRRRGFRAGAESATGVAAAPGKQWQRGSSCSPAAAAPWTLLRRGSSCGWGSAAAVFVWCLFLFCGRLKTAFFALSVQDVENAADRRGSFLTCQPALRHPSIPGPGDYAACFSPPLPVCFCCYFLIVKNCVFGLLTAGGALQLRRSPPAPQPCPPACWLDLSPMPGAKPPPYPFRLIFVSILKFWKTVQTGMTVQERKPPAAAGSAKRGLPCPSAPLPPPSQVSR